MSSKAQLDDLPFSPTQLSLLHSASFNVVSDLDGLKPSDLVEGLNFSPFNSISFFLELSCSPKDAAEIIRIYQEFSGGGKFFFKLSTTVTDIPHTHPLQAKTALDLLKLQESTQHIPTGSNALDSLLGKGISLGTITEFCFFHPFSIIILFHIGGSPGTGKTQLVMQLCLQVQISLDDSKTPVEVVYIGFVSHLPLSSFFYIYCYSVTLDSEGSFMPDRVYSMATALYRALEDKFETNLVNSLISKLSETNLRLKYKMLCLIYMSFVRTRMLLFLRLFSHYHNSLPNIQVYDW